MKNKSIYLISLLSLVMLSTPAIADSCDVNIQQNGADISQNQYNTWKNRIKNSSSASLRQAYADDRCTIRQGPHGGGHVPANANNPHITVLIWGGDTCHVFTKVGQQVYFPSTCF